MSERPPRTSCACPDCVRCCTEQPGSLADGDLEAIAAYQGKTVREASLQFWASPGALVANSRTMKTARVGTITPQLRRGCCVFLDADQRCSIHPVAPAGCALFDTHMTGAEAQPRGLWLIRTQMAAGYQSLRRTLPEAKSYKPRGY